MIKTLTVGKFTKVRIAVIILAFSSVFLYTQERVYSTEELILMAIENSFEIKAERAALGLRHGAWRFSLRNFLPKVTIDGMSDERLVLNGQDNFNKSIGLSIDQPLWDGGQAYWSRTFEEREITLAAFNLRKKELELGDSVEQALRSIIAGKSRLQIRQQSLEMASEQLSLMLIEAGLGMTLDSDLLEAELQISGLELDYAEGVLDLKQAEVDLQNLLGMDKLPATAEKLDTESQLIYIDSGRFCELVLARSTALMTQRQVIQKQLAESTSQRLTWLPVINAKISLRASGDNYPLTEYSWNIGLNFDFSLPFLDTSAAFSGGRDGKSITTMNSSARSEPMPNPAALLGTQSRALSIAAEQEKLSLMIEALRRQAETALERYMLIWDRRQLASRQVELMLKKLEFITLEHELGRKTRMELVSAGLEYSEKQLALVDAHLAVLSAERELEKLAEIEPGLLRAYFPGGIR